MASASAWTSTNWAAAPIRSSSFTAMTPTADKTQHPGSIGGDSGSTIAMPRSRYCRVAFSLRKCHLGRNRQGHMNCGTVLVRSVASRSENVAEVVVRSRDSLNVRIAQPSRIRNFVRRYRIEVAGDDRYLPIVWTRNRVFQYVRRIHTAIHGQNRHLGSQSRCIRRGSRQNVEDLSTLLQLDSDRIVFENFRRPLKV